jgi:predicted nucleotidyltransferase
MDITDFLNRVTSWAMENEDIRAVILVGSHARGEARKDSDVDLVIITTGPDFLMDSTFMETFGTVMKLQREDYGRVTSIRVWYEEDDLEVEFGITSPEWLEKPLDRGTRRVLADGFRVLVDKGSHFKDQSLLVY